MEPLGGFAAAAQITGYGLNIALAINDIRRLVHNAPKQLQEQADQLIFLKSIIESIKQNCYLHTTLIINFLDAIYRKINNLNRILNESLGAIEKASLFRPWLVFSTIRVNQQIQESLAALAQDRCILNLYMTSLCGAQLCAKREPGSEMSGQTGYPSQETSLVKREAGEIATRAEEPHPKSVMPIDSKSSSISSSTISQMEQSTTSDFDQKLGHMNAVGKDSKNELGGHQNMSRFQRTKQEIGNANAGNGGTNTAGNVTYRDD